MTCVTRVWPTEWISVCWVWRRQSSELKVFRGTRVWHFRPIPWNTTNRNIIQGKQALIKKFPIWFAHERMGENNLYLAHVPFFFYLINQSVNHSVYWLIIFKNSKWKLAHSFVCLCLSHTNDYGCVSHRLKTS